ncbi:Acyltransferase family protein [Roseibium album]|nr:Acyltransferase family protein [Roseibium album]
MLVQLQYARAIAALLVVYFHSVLQLERMDPDTVFASFRFGETGVDLFFVLSGFVMWLTTADRNMSPVGFYRRRIERIVPLYWSLTLLASAIALTFPSYLNSTKFDLQHLLASLFFVPWINPASGAEELITPVVIPGWTLNFEMYFYLIFGSLLLLPKITRIPALFVVFVAIFLLSNWGSAKGVMASFYGNAIVFEFLAGVLIAKLYLDKRLLQSGLALVLVLVAFVGLVAADAAHLEVPRLISAGLPAAIIIYGLVSLDFTKVAEFKFLHLIGDASYSLYLTHVFTLVAVRIFYRYQPIEWLNVGPVFLTVCVVSSVLVALMSFWLFEKPVADYLAKKRAGPRTARATVSN